MCAGSAVRFWNWHRTTLTPRPSWTLLNAELLVHDAEKRIVPMTRSRKLTLATLLGLALCLGVACRTQSFDLLGTVVAVDDQRAANRLAVVFKDGEAIARTYTDGDGHFQVIFRIETSIPFFFSNDRDRFRYKEGQLQRLLTPDKRANTSMGPTYFVKVFEGDASLLPFAINNNVLRLSDQGVVSPNLPPEVQFPTRVPDSMSTPSTSEPSIEPSVVPEATEPAPASVAAGERQTNQVSVSSSDGGISIYWLAALATIAMAFVAVLALVVRR